MGNYQGKHILTKSSSKEKNNASRPFTLETLRRWLEMCHERINSQMPSKLDFVCLKGYLHDYTQRVQAPEKQIFFLKSFHETNCMLMPKPDNIAQMK